MGKRILVVDDAKDIRFLLRASLQKAGYEVCEAENGLRAAERVQDFKPDLITLDVNMPIADGFSLCKILKTSQLTSHIPIIMLTVRGEQVAQERGMAAGADDYTTKPVVIPDLLARIAGLISACERGEPVAHPTDANSTNLGKSRRIGLATLAGGAGALQSARRFLPLLTSCPAFPVVVLLQIPLFAARYQAAQFAVGSPARYQVGNDRVELEPGCIYLLPSEGPILVPVRSGERFALAEYTSGPDEPQTSLDPPRADQLLRAAAELVGAASFSVLLSGTGTDGVAGLLATTQQRGQAFCEAPEAAVVPDLPRAGLERNSAAARIGVREIALALSGG